MGDPISGHCVQRLFSQDGPSVICLETLPGFESLVFDVSHRTAQFYVYGILLRRLYPGAVCTGLTQSVLTGHIVNRIDRGHGEHISGEEDVLVEDVLYALGRNQHHDRENEIHQ